MKYASQLLFDIDKAKKAWYNFSITLIFYKEG